MVIVPSAWNSASCWLIADGNSVHSYQAVSVVPVQCRLTASPSIGAVTEC